VLRSSRLRCYPTRAAASHCARTNKLIHAPAAPRQVRAPGKVGVEALWRGAIKPTATSDSHLLRCAACGQDQTVCTERRAGDEVGRTLLSCERACGQPNHSEPACVSADGSADHFMRESCEEASSQRGGLPEPSARASAKVPSTPARRLHPVLSDGKVSSTHAAVTKRQVAQEQLTWRCEHRCSRRRSSAAQPC
jgi:hypothetical protein